MNFTIVYDKLTYKIESFIVPDYPWETNLFKSVKLGIMQSKIQFPMEYFTTDVRELQRLLDKKLWQKSI